MLDRQISPKTNRINKIQIVEPDSMTLTNGIRVNIFRNDQQQAVKIDLVFNSGTACQPAPLVANTTIRILKEGSGSFPGTKLMSKIDFFGAYLSQNATKDESTITLLSLKKNIREVLPMLESLIKEPSFSVKEFKMVRDIEKEEFIIQNEKPKNIARRAFNELVFGKETPYGKMATAQDYDNLTIEQLKNFHINNYGSNNCTILLSGPIDENIIEGIENHLGNSWNAPGQKSEFSQPSDFENQTVYIKKENALQSAIQIGMPIMARTDPDYIPFLVLNTIFGGYFGSRLMNNIREDKGYTYGIHSQVTPLKKGTIFIISTEVGTDVTQNTIEEIKNEMKLLQINLVNNEELNLVKSYLTGSYLRSLDGVYNQAEKFKSIMAWNLGMDYYEKSLLKIQEITAEELQLLAKKYLNFDAMTNVIVGA